jgi:hypothetical protein
VADRDDGAIDLVREQYPDQRALDAEAEEWLSGEAKRTPRCIPLRHEGAEETPGELESVAVDFRERIDELERAA